MSGNFAVITSNMLLSASATARLDIDTYTVDSGASREDLHLLIEVTYNATASTTGVILSVFDGPGNPDPAATGPIPCIIGSTYPIYPTVGTVATLNTTAPSQASVQTVRTKYNYSLSQNARWAGLRFINTDASNTAKITIYADY